MKWFVIYTKPQHEIKVTRALKAMGFNTYCPTYTQLKRYTDRKKKVTKPFLRSYVLIKIADKDRKQVFSIPGVLRYVFWLGKPLIVDEKEIDLMESHLKGIYNNISNTQLKKGKDFKITKGPFVGQKGKVVNFSKKILKLELHSLNFLVSLKTA